MSKATRTLSEQYLTTTSSRGREINLRHFEDSEEGLRRRLGPWLPRRGTRVLDLGSGLGELLHLCGSLGCTERVGVNLCSDEIDAARPFVAATFECMDVLDYLRSTERTFDWIGALNILEHLEKDKLVEVLRLAGERLSPDGVIVAMVPNAISPFGSLTRHWDFTHEWAFTPNNFLQLAPITGFSRNVEFRECGPTPHGPVSVVRWVLWQGIRLAVRAWCLIELADAKGGIYTMDMLVKLRKA